MKEEGHVITVILKTEKLGMKQTVLARVSITRQSEAGSSPSDSSALSSLIQRQVFGDSDIKHLPAALRVPTEQGRERGAPQGECHSLSGDGGSFHQQI